MSRKTKSDNEVFNPIDGADSKSNFGRIETYKAIRTNIMFSVPKNDKAKVIAVTSAAPGEGKSTTAINLAITISQMGVKTLIIDGDMRKSRVHRYLSLERKIGLSNILCGFCSIEDAVKKNIRENLDCITAGEIPPNPAELLGSKVFEELIEKLSEYYDYIIIDTPPMNVVTDALLVAKVITGVVVVARKKMTTFKMLDKALLAVSQAGVTLLGVILLGGEGTKKRYGYTYHSYKYTYMDEYSSKK